MEDLRLLAIEQEFVVLEGANGEKFRLALDDSLRKALRADKSPRVESDTVSPREIQELVRSGHNVEEIVAKTGAPFAFVEKFAVPVLEELEHTVNSAQSVRLSFIGERYGETNHIEFGVLIRERLDQLGATNIRWTARRGETGATQIVCSFELNGAESAARWSFDLRHLSLSPENEVALNLASSPQSDTLVPRVKPVAVVEATPVATFASQVIAPKTDIAPSLEAPLVGKNLTSSLGDTQEFADVIPFGRGRNTTAQVPVIAAGTSATIDDEPVEELDENENLLDGLRRRRDQRESKTGFSPLLEVVRVAEPDDETDESDFDEQTVWLEVSDEVVAVPIADEDLSQEIEDFDEPADASTEPEAAPEVESAVESEVAPEAAPPAPKRGRASMPSWDEIVFGTKADNKDD